MANIIERSQLDTYCDLIPEPFIARPELSSH